MNRILYTFLAIVLPLTATAQPSPALLSSIVKINATVSEDARTASGLGTEREGNGVLIDDDGLIVTIGYLILEASAVKVEFAGGVVKTAEIVAYDHDTGFGLIRTRPPPGVTSLDLGRSGDLEPGQQVLVAGFGGQNEAMGALVVDRREFAGYWEYLLKNAIFVSPPYPRFGGAALIDGRGELVGIGSLIVPNALERDDGIVPGNMFVPIDALKAALADLIAHGRSLRRNRPWLGLQSEAVRGRIFVARVPKSGPAWAAGIRPGDLVLSVAGKPVESLADFYRKIWALGEPGVVVPLRILRGETLRDLDIRSIDRSDWLKPSPNRS